MCAKKRHNSELLVFKKPARVPAVESFQVVKGRIEVGTFDISSISDGAKKLLFNNTEEYLPEILVTFHTPARPTLLAPVREELAGKEITFGRFCCLLIGGQLIGNQAANIAFVDGAALVALHKGGWYLSVCTPEEYDRTGYEWHPSTHFISL